MVVGQTGCGKTTLLNSLLNYLTGINFDDNFRYKIIYEGPNVNNAKSGMGVISNTSSLILTIKGNTIAGKSSRGIRIVKPTKKVSILSNTITTSNPKSKKYIGISCQKTKSGTKIKKNKITGNKTGPGIYLDKAKASVSGNKVKKSIKKIAKN